MRRPIPTRCPNGIDHRSLTALSNYYGIPLSTLWDRLNRQQLPLWAALGLRMTSEQAVECSKLSRGQKLRILRAQNTRRKPCTYTRMLMERSTK